MIAILDYGSGNLKSAQRAFELTDHEVVLTSDPALCLSADGLVVPGVGAFGACMEQLLSIQGDEIIRERAELNRPLLGICVGAQILFSSGSEKGSTAALGIFSGDVSVLKHDVLPHMGWNTVKAGANSALLEGLDQSSFYFVHSYAAQSEVDGAITSWTEYGQPFIAAIESRKVSATQFHPEKSGASGARLIKNWVNSW